MEPEHAPAKSKQAAKPNQSPQRLRGYTLAATVILTAFLVLLFWVLTASAGRIELFMLVVFGWLAYPVRVMSELGPGLWPVVSWIVGTGILGLGAVTLGTHYFARWLCRGSWPWKRTAQLTGLIILLILAGFVCTELVEQIVWISHSPEQWKYPSRHSIGSIIE
jgi:hypothetical protein